MRGAAALVLSTALALTGCASPAVMGVPRFTAAEAPVDDFGFQNIGYAAWNDSEPPYQLFPGDEVELVIPSAPENNKVLTVQPDGRINLPLVGELMAAARPLSEVEADAERRYASQLRRPDVQMSVRAQPVKVFVGGEVGQPAVYDMIGDGDALRAVIQAGGFRPSADLRRVIIIRRGEGGSAMMRTADLSRAFRHGDQPDFVPLARGDIVYVPRSGVAQAGLAMQQYFRDVLPLSFSYALNGYQ